VPKDLLRQYDAAAEAGEFQAISMVARITEGLTKKELAVFQQIIWMRDVQRDYEDGRENLPTGIESIEWLNQRIADLEAIVVENPAINEALGRRKAWTRAITQRLVELKLLRPEVLDDDRYFHRQVLAHLEERRTAALMARDVRDRKKGFQKGRKEGLDQFDFNTDYFESELEWLSQANTKIIRVEILHRLKELLDVRSRLIREAKSVNEAVVNRILGPQPGEVSSKPEPYKPFEQRIAIAFSQLARRAMNNQLWDGEGGRWGDYVEDLGEAYAEWKDAMRDLDPDDRIPFRFEDERTFAFLADLARHEGAEGQLVALSVFKTLNDRRLFTEKSLRDAKIEPRTWSDLIPEGHKRWSPDAHPKYYPAKTVNENVLDRVLAKEEELEESDIRTVLARRPQEVWVIPANLATVFDRLAAPRTDAVAEKAARFLNRIWKQWVLLNPKRFLKYNINNMSGDLDIVLAYNYRAAKGMGRAILDLHAYFSHKPMSEKTRAELDRFLKRGVGTSTLTNQEIEHLAKDLRSRVPGLSDHNVMVQVWEGIRKYTTLRENILRLTSQRFFEAQLESGKKPLGASRRAEMLELYKARAAGKISNEEIAGKLARELMGDYGNISEGGRWLREKLIPFYSWIEINAPRYYFLFQNAAHDDSGGSKVGTVGSLTFKTAKGTAGTAVKGVTGAAIAVNAFAGIVAAFNYAMGNGDDMEEIYRTRRQLHLILGHDEDGEVISIRIQGAWSDALEWFGLGDLPADINDFREEGPGVLEEKALDVLKSPINRLYRGLSPFYKTTFETIIGYRAFPDVLRSSDKFFDLGYTPVRDRGLELSRVWSAEDLYLRSWDQLYKVGAVEKPSPPAYDAKDVAQSLLTYKTDPGQSAYWGARIRASKFAEKKLHRPRTAFSVTETGNALYWWRKSLQMGQDEKALEHLNHYIKLRGARGADYDALMSALNTSIENQHPLHDIPKNRRQDYSATLTQQQLDELNAALVWYYRLYPQ
jgi:hypothetical protein